MSPNNPKTSFTESINELDRRSDAEARKWLEEKRRAGTFGSLCRGVGAFWESYFAKKGCRDGVPGLFNAVNAGMLPFLTYLKYRELKKGA